MNTNNFRGRKHPSVLGILALCALATIGSLVFHRVGQGSGQTGEKTSDEPVDARRALQMGVEDLRAGRVERALTHLDRVAQASPESEPYLWQRGIAQYFAGKYEAGQKQFESHRKVNPNDVENATWHFLCVAARKDVKAARAAMLPAPGDRRVPMEQLHALYKGEGSRQAVEQAVDQFPKDSLAYRDARFYADLYLGLLAHAEGKTEEAARLLKAAAEVPDQNVMADVARLCRDRLVDTEATGNATSKGETGQTNPAPTNGQR